MFTGIIEELGEVVELSVAGGCRSGHTEQNAELSPVTAVDGESGQLAVRGQVVTEQAGPGDSIAVNGVCLTVVEIRGDVFTADVMAETLKRSNLGALRAGERVNLERAVALSTRMGGHLVQGHVDGTGTVLYQAPGREWTTVRFSLPPGLARYVAEKGSIAVDGVSLTVVDVTADSFEVGLIPTTLAVTTLGIKEIGDSVNLEVDVIAKYVERLLSEGRGNE